MTHNQKFIARLFIIIIVNHANKHTHITHTRILYVYVWESPISNTFIR